uniref:Meg domain-containing protein n=1 Tax=Triticum urartu TaxID=4572 RepID=A0A8R7R6H9_TRIUA
MEKYTEHVRLLLPLSILLLVCFIVHVQCGRIEDIGNRKINIPYGLCGPRKQFGKCKDHCWCCLVSPTPGKNICYGTPEICDENCRV